MTINLNTEELVRLVGAHVESIGIKGDYVIKFNKRNQNQIDASIEILPAGTKEATDNSELVKATEFDDSLIN